MLDNCLFPVFTNWITQQISPLFNPEADTGCRRSAPPGFVFVLGCVPTQWLLNWTLDRVFAGQRTWMVHHTGGIWSPRHCSGVLLPDHWHFAASWPLSLGMSSMYFQSLLFLINTVFVSVSINGAVLQPQG